MKDKAINEQEVFELIKHSISGDIIIVSFDESEHYIVARVKTEFGTIQKSKSVTINSCLYLNGYMDVGLTINK